MMNESILSASSLSAFLSCPRRFYYSHILRLPEAQNTSALAGTATHAGAEALHRGKTPEKAVEALRTAWAKEVAAVPADDLAADLGASQSAEKMLAVYRTKVLPTWQPDLVEQPFTMRIWDQLVTGTIDAADTATDEVSDLKTTDSKNFRPKGYVLQMTIYAAGYRSITGRWPKKLTLRVLTRAGRARQYEISPDFGELRTVIEVVREGIGRGDFPPDGAAAGRCRWCPFRRTCPASTELEKA